MHMHAFKTNTDAFISSDAEATSIPEPYIISALHYLEDYTESVLNLHFLKKPFTVKTLYLPSDEDTSSFARFARFYKLSGEEMLLLLIAIAPHLVPGFFDTIIQRFLQQGGEFPEFGGVKGTQHRGTLPTGETALFLLAGTDPRSRLELLSLFDNERFLFRNKILSVESVKPGDPILSGRLVLDPEFAEVFTTDKVGLPAMTANFPAEHINTQLEWDDLVLPENVWQQIHELENWIKHHSTLMNDWGMKRKLKPGYRVLFYGPPGTGKTLTATLLGKFSGREVFRIDLSMIISKYIGETEKNLATLFDKAEQKNWILFFDEADAIFGKRTGVRDAHDKYANQEVSYLLQRIESHSGLTILASNFKNNIDDAFVRRFNSIIYFPMPKAEQRLELLKKSFPSNITFANDVNLQSIAASYELTGAHVMNVVQYVCLSALEKGSFTVSHEDILRGVRRELEKEGK